MNEPRILAIDLRSQRFGFAVFEGASRLLDFGRRNCRLQDASSDAAIMVRKRIVPLLALFEPSVMVVKRVSGLQGLSRLRNEHTVQALKREAQERSLELVFLTRRDIRELSQGYGKGSKDEIAAWIAGLFPEVAWKLPPRRKNWQPEHHNMIIFVAISLGLTYLARCSDPEQTQALGPG